MPETYFTTKTEKGNISISEDVIAAITVAAIAEVEGVAQPPLAAVQELVGKRSAAKNIHASFDGETLLVEATIMVRQSASITAVAEKAQRAVAAAVESTTGLRSMVNIHVSGVAFEK